MSAEDGELPHAALVPSFSLIAASEKWPASAEAQGFFSALK